MPWRAIYRDPGSSEYMEMYIQDTEDHYNEDYGIMVTNEMEAKRIATIQERKARERAALEGKYRREYTLESLERVK